MRTGVRACVFEMASNYTYTFKPWRQQLGGNGGGDGSGDCGGGGSGGDNVVDDV